MIALINFLNLGSASSSNHKLLLNHLKFSGDGWGITIYFGKYESTPRDGEEFAKAKCNFICSFDGGETMLHLAQRIYNLLDELKEQPEKTYLLVAHNGIARIIAQIVWRRSFL